MLQQDSDRSGCGTVINNPLMLLFYLGKYPGLIFSCNVLAVVQQYDIIKDFPVRWGDDRELKMFPKAKVKH
jgi:hypothetical protein